jgi:DNA-binding Xre family transcriptional regulator
MKINLNETAKMNIARMKTHEGGNNHFAEKVGISSGKASQLTGRGTSIAAGILCAVCEKYQISESDFFNKKWEPFSFADVFFGTYYAYFFTTWEDSATRIDIAEMSIGTVGKEREIEFKINNKKSLSGRLFVENSFLRGEMHRRNENYLSMFVMPWNPAIIPPKKYYGGLGLLFLPTDSELVPVAQKIILSGVPLNIDKNSDDNAFVRDSLRLNGDSRKVKINIEDEKRVFYYLRKKFL